MGEPLVVRHDLFPEHKLIQDILIYFESRIKIKPGHVVYDHLSIPFENVLETLKTDAMNWIELIERKELNYRL